MTSTNFFNYWESEQLPTNLKLIFDNSEKDKNRDLKIVKGSEEENSTFFIDFKSLQKNLKFYPQYEELLYTAIRNFIRKNNFADLNESLADEEITEDKYYEEIDHNSNKYAITLKNITSFTEANLIAHIVAKIGHDLREFTTSEISEMFSVKEKEFLSLLLKESK